MRLISALAFSILVTFSAFAVSGVQNNYSVGKTLSVANEYVTTGNKVDGSFESGTTSWATSTGTIVRTANTATTTINGNYNGVWSGTGTATLDLQWTATASNTYEPSMIVQIPTGQTAANYTLCAVVNGIETGCKVLDTCQLDRQCKVSVVADSVLGSAFYLRLKHTGSGAFFAIVDSGKIEAWTPQIVGTATTSIVQSYQDGMATTATYTPTFQGFGTVSNVNFRYGKDGEFLTIIGYFTSGTGGSGENRISLPNGLVSSSSLQTISYVTQMASSSTTLDTILSVLIEPSKTYLTFGAFYTGGSQLTKLSGYSVGATYSFQARIPIQGWSAAPTLLALPTSKENVFSAYISAESGTPVVASQNVSWISSITDNGAGDYIINFNTGVTGFSVVPSVNLTAQYSSNADVGANVHTLTTSSVRVRTVAVSTGTNADRNFLIILQKQSPDYTPPGVFVGNVAKNQVAIVQYRGNGTRTTLSTSPVAMPLTAVKGDTSIVSIASNQFTLQAGEYEIDWKTFALNSVGTAATRFFTYLYDITSSNEIERAFPIYMGTPDIMQQSSSSTKISITSQKTFELRAVLSVSPAQTVYLGDAMATPNDLNGFIKITKLNGQ